jgi:hypothetical protein
MLVFYRKATRLSIALFGLRPARRLYCELRVLYVAFPKSVQPGWLPRLSHGFCLKTSAEFLRSNRPLGRHTEPIHAVSRSGISPAIPFVLS